MMLSTIRPLRTNPFQKALAQLGDKGAIQMFKPDAGGNMLLGLIGQWQFEVVRLCVKTKYDAANALAILRISRYDVRLAQERLPKIHFHPLREHAGLALQLRC